MPQPLRLLLPGSPLAASRPTAAQKSRRTNGAGLWRTCRTGLGAPAGQVRQQSPSTRRGKAATGALPRPVGVAVPAACRHRALPKAWRPCLAAATAAGSTRSVRSTRASEAAERGPCNAISRPFGACLKQECHKIGWYERTEMLQSNRHGQGGGEVQRHSCRWSNLRLYSSFVNESSFRLKEFTITQLCNLVWCWPADGPT